MLNAYDREMILRLGPVISKEFSLAGTVGQYRRPDHGSPCGAGYSRLHLERSLRVWLETSALSGTAGAGLYRAVFISGIKAISHGLTAFVLLRVGVNLGAGWGEPVGVSNTAEWWPKEKRGFALGCIIPAIRLARC
nr:Uncharacterised protein [Klebsiella pneumoniae]